MGLLQSKYRDFRSRRNFKRKEIAKISNEILDKISVFSLSGIEGEAKIIRVIDGDTVEVALFVQLEDLCKARPVGKKKLLQSPIFTLNREAIFLTKVKCRLNGIDTAEKNTAQGKKAKELMELQYTSLNNIVYLVASGFDKYGRLLVDLYTNSKKMVLINNHLINYVDPHLGKLAEPYFGGTKSEYMKRLT